LGGLAEQGERTSIQQLPEARFAKRAHLWEVIVQ
jgi:hypothetical protein